MTSKVRILEQIQFQEFVQGKLTILGECQHIKYCSRWQSRSTIAGLEQIDRAATMSRAITLVG